MQINEFVRVQSVVVAIQKEWDFRKQNSKISFKIMSFVQCSLIRRKWFWECPLNLHNF